MAQNRSPGLQVSPKDFMLGARMWREIPDGGFWSSHSVGVSNRERALRCDASTTYLEQ
jgi:hypothetical protein